MVASAIRIRVRRAVANNRMVGSLSRGGVDGSAAGRKSGLLRLCLPMTKGGADGRWRQPPPAPPANAGGGTAGAGGGCAALNRTTLGLEKNSWGMLFFP